LDEEEEWKPWVDRFERSVEAPIPRKCRKIRDLCREERKCLKELLSFSVEGRCRQVLSGVVVNGMKRSTTEQEDAQQSSRRVSRHSGVEIAREHTPDRCYSGRYGTITFLAYVRSKREPIRTELVARVSLFKKLPLTARNQPVVDPGKVRRGVFFVRAADLGQVVGFGPRALPGDGAADASEIDFWMREQVVLRCYNV
jgi:hypothetical protein